jgi:hypothetical protein
MQLGSMERPGDRSGAASVVYGDALYIFGGYGGNGRLDNLYKFSFGAFSMPEISHGVIVYN